MSRARVIAGMVRKDLLRTIRRPLGTLIMLAFPLAFAGMLGVVFGGSETPTIPKVELLIEDRDGELLSAFLTSAFQSEQMAEYFDAQPIESGGRERMERGEASALLVIPDGFSEEFLLGRPLTLELVRNPAERILPEIAEQVALILAEVLDSGSRALRGPLEEMAGLLDDPSGAVSDPAVAGLAVSFNGVFQSAGDLIFPPAITLDVVDLAPDESDADSDTPGFSVFLLILPGVSVFGLFMLGDMSMRDILTEAQEGTLRRQLSGPVGAVTLVAAKAARTAVVAAIGIVILLVLALVLLRGHLDVVAFVAISLSLIVLVTGAASFLYGIARSEAQGATIASVVYLFMAFVGGGFLPTDNLPAALQRVAPYVPFNWASEGFLTVLRNGGGLVDVSRNVALLLGSGLLLLIVGGRLISRRLLEGRLG